MSSNTNDSKIESKYDVFVCHNGSEKEDAKQLSSGLEYLGLKVWLDVWVLNPGDNWQDGMERGLKESRAVAVLIGPTKLSGWAEAERQVAMDLATSKQGRVIPVLLPGAPPDPDLPRFMRRQVWVDLRDGLSAKGLDDLYRGVTGTRTDYRRLNGRALSKRLQSNRGRLATRFLQTIASAILLLTSFFCGYLWAPEQTNVTDYDCAKQPGHTDAGVLDVPGTGEESEIEHLLEPSSQSGDMRDGRNGKSGVRVNRRSRNVERRSTTEIAGLNEGTDAGHLEGRTVRERKVEEPLSPKPRSKSGFNLPRATTPDDVLQSGALPKARLEQHSP